MTVLVIALVTSVIGGGVMVVKNAYTKVTLKAEAETLRSTALTAVINELRYAQNINPEEPDPADPDKKTVLAFDSPSRGYRIYLPVNPEGTSNEITVCSMVNGTQVPLLTEKTQTDALVPTLEVLSYNSEEKTFTLNIAIKYKNTVFIQGDDITINPINHQYGQ